MKGFFWKSYGFTLIEIMISIMISSFILVWLVTFISKINSDITYTQNKSAIYQDVVDFINTLNKWRMKYYVPVLIAWDATRFDSILLTWTWSWYETSDVVSWSWTYRWILVWVVDMEKKSPRYLMLDDKPSLYWYKYLWIKTLTETQTKNITLSWALVSQLKFSEDEVFKNLNVVEMKNELYNSWSIIDSFINFNIVPSDDIVWMKVSDYTPITWLVTVNLNF